MFDAPEESQTENDTPSALARILLHGGVDKKGHQCRLKYVIYIPGRLVGSLDTNDLIMFET